MQMMFTSETNSERLLLSLTLYRFMKKKKALNQFMKFSIIIAIFRTYRNKFLATLPYAFSISTSMNAVDLFFSLQCTIICNAFNFNNENFPIILDFYFIY